MASLPPTLLLTIEKGPRAGETIQRNPASGQTTTVRIGRVVRGNTFTIKDPTISQKHLTIEHVAGSGWVVTDLKTSNGTFLNNAAINPQVRTPLKDGDWLKMGGNTTIAVRIGKTESTSTKEEEDKEVGVSKARVKRSRRYETRSGAVETTVGIGKTESTSAKEEEDKEVGVSKARVKRSRKYETRSGAVETTTIAGGIGKTESTSAKEEEEMGISKARVKRSRKYERRSGEVESTGTDPRAGKKKNKNAGGARRRGRDRARVASSADLIVELKAPETDEKSEARDADQTGKADVGAEASDGEPRNDGAVDGVAEVVGLEKMTVGEWLDSVEKYLPMVIRDVADEMIADLRERARRFKEFISERGRQKASSRDASDQH